MQLNAPKKEQKIKLTLFLHTVEQKVENGLANRHEAVDLYATFCIKCDHDLYKASCARDVSICGLLICAVF